MKPPKPILVIVEGADRVGKSTLVAELQNQLPRSIAFHFGAPEKLEDHILAPYNFLLNDPYLPSNYGHIILDRSFFSAMVYETTRRKGSFSFTDVEQFLERICAKFNLKLIFLTAEWCVVEPHHKQEVGEKQGFGSLEFRRYENNAWNHYSVLFNRGFRLSSSECKRYHKRSNDFHITVSDVLPFITT